MGRKKEPSPVPVLDDEEYEVRKIVGHKGYTPADDTWEPKESLEGGAEGILQRYIEKRKDKGYVFFKDGSRKAKVYKYLDTHGLESDVLGFDAGDDDEGLSPSEDEDDEEEEEEQAAPARDKKSSKTASAAAAVNEKDAEKERKRKKRESEAAAAAAAAAEDDAAMDEDEDERRSSKKSRRTSGSPMPIPPSVLRGRDERDKAKKEKADRERAEKENSAVAAESSRSSKKPSSKRSEEDSSSAQLMKKRPSSSAAAAKVTQESDDDEDARVGESLKRSPLKEKKADQRKSEEPARSSTKPVSVSAAAADEPIKVATLPAAPEVINQGPAAAQEEEEDESTLPLGSDMNRKLSSWEDLVTVESLEQSPPSEKDSLIKEEYKWLIRWNDNVQNGTRVASEEWVGNSLARKKFPQGLLSFYEDHLKFKSTPEDGEEEPNGAVNGEDAVMD